MAVKHVDDSNFEAEVLQASGKVLVDFWATWCGPCKMQGPIIEELAEAHPDAQIVKLDVDEGPDTAEKYSIMSIPTIAVFENGEVVTKAVGVQQKEQLEQLLGL